MKKSNIVNICLIVIMLLTLLISSSMNLIWMMANDYTAEFITFLTTMFFLIISVIYFVKVDLKWTISMIITILMIVFWILMLLCGAMNIIYYTTDIYIGFLLDFFISPPLIGISYITDMLNANSSVLILGIAYIIISLGVLSIPVIRFRKGKKSVT